MNLHEECLLKYLLNPIDIFHSTELLRLTNDMIKQGNLKTNSLAKVNEFSYTSYRVWFGELKIG